MHETESWAGQGGLSASPWLPMQQLEAPSTGKLERALLGSTGTSGVVSWQPTAKLRLQEHLWGRRKPAALVPPMAYQTVPVHFSHCSACINVFSHEHGRHCNDNQGDHTKLAWKCTTEFSPRLPFCYATHLTFWSAAKVELSPLLSPTSAAAMSAWGSALFLAVVAPQSNEVSAGEVLHNSGRKRACRASSVRTIIL